MWTAFLNLSASLSSMVLPASSSSRPSRSRLYTARKTQPWPWKSANCVFWALSLSPETSVRKLRSDQSPLRAAPSGLSCSMRARSEAESFLGSFGYMSWPSASLSHQV